MTNDEFVMCASIGARHLCRFTWDYSTTTEYKVDNLVKRP